MLHRVATKEREEIKRTTKQKMARRHSKEEENHLEQKNNRQGTMEGIDEGLHSAVDGQSQGEGVNVQKSVLTYTLVQHPVTIKMKHRKYVKEVCREMCKGDE